MFLEMNGHCGTRSAPNLLPLLSGPPATSCPTATGLQDADVLAWGATCGAWLEAPRNSLTPRARAVVRLVRQWQDAPEYREYLQDQVAAEHRAMAERMKKDGAP